MRVPRGNKGQIMKPGQSLGDSRTTGVPVASMLYANSGNSDISRLKKRRKKQKSKQTTNLLANFP